MRATGALLFGFALGVSVSLRAEGQTSASPASWPPPPVAEMRIEEEMPLSRALREHKQAHPESFLPATRWCRAAGETRHRLAKAALLYALRQAPEDSPPRRVAQWLEALPVCERTPHYRWDAEALEVRPWEDRRLAAGDRLVFFPRPQGIYWLAPDGTLLLAEFTPGKVLQEYDWMATPRAQADHAWLVRPDGVRQRVGVAAWNENESRPRLMPGTLVLPEYGWWKDSPVLPQLAAWLNGEVRW